MGILQMKWMKRKTSIRLMSRLLLGFTAASTVLFMLWLTLNVSKKGAWSPLDATPPHTGSVMPLLTSRRQQRRPSPSGRVFTPLVIGPSPSTSRKAALQKGKGTFVPPEVTSSEAKFFTLEQASNATMFYNVTAKKFQPLWTWPLDDSGGRVKGRSLLVVMYNRPGWIHLHEWNDVLKTRQCYLPCHFTSDVRRIKDADAVIFYGVSLKTPPRLPPRPPGQVWLWLSLEPPAKMNAGAIQAPLWERQINWTVSYRRDSDIWFPYQRFHKRSLPFQGSMSSLVASKTKMVAWVVSSCRSKSGRMAYFHQLRQHLHVDVYGRCGNLTCGARCYETVSDYKFYLSFENSLCRDYVTEKVFEYMKHSRVVPVVRGGADYRHVLPSGSYISTDQFRSPRELAEYLKFLDRTPGEYVKYFQWRKTLEISELTEGPSCDLCTRLLRPELHQNVYRNVWTWWYSGQCRKATQL